MANVLVIGCGYVGKALAQDLLAAGHHVWGLRRDPSQLPADIRPIACDVVNLANLNLEFTPDYVFYLPSAGQYNVATYQTVYVDGVHNLLNCLTSNQLSPKRIFYISSTSVYGQSDGSWVDEMTPPQPLGPHANLLLAGEQAVLKSQYPTTVVRFAGIYGPERDYFVQQVKAGKMPLSSGPLYTNRIHRDDCAGMLQFLMTQPAVDDLYIGVDSAPVLKNTVITWLAEKLKVALPEVASGTSIPEQRMRGNKRCSNRRLIAAGYRLQCPSFREGYAELI